MASGADTHTHTHTHIRTEVILRNQARAWFKKFSIDYKLELGIIDLPPLQLIIYTANR